MEKRNGSVTGAPNVMLFNQTGRLTPRSVGLENIVVIVAQFSQGETFLFKFSVFLFLYF